MALKSHDWRLLFSRADIFSFELQVQPQRKRKTKGLSAGRQARQLVDRDKLCFDFFFFVWKKRLSRRVTDGIVVCRREKRFCESRVPAAVVHLFSDYTITTILYYIHQMGSTKKKEKKKFVRIQTHVFLACLAVVSVLYPMPGIPRETEGLGKQGCRQTAFGTNKARHV